MYPFHLLKAIPPTSRKGALTLPKKDAFTLHITDARNDLKV